jgi:hypothetical protein
MPSLEVISNQLYPDSFQESVSSQLATPISVSRSWTPNVPSTATTAQSIDHSRRSPWLDQSQDLDLTEATINDQAICILSSNWMSPEFDSIIDWDNQIPWEQPNYEMPQSSFPMNHSIESERHAGITGNPTAKHGNDMIRTGHMDTYLSDYDNSKSPLQGIRDLPPSTLPSNSFYVGSDGARAPFKGLTHSRRTESSKINESNITLVTADSLTDHHDELVSDISYLNLVNGLVSTIPKQRNGGFDLTMFPNQRDVGALCELYFNKFHPIFPILRKRTFVEESAAHWNLLLAVAATGSLYCCTSLGLKTSKMLCNLVEEICGINDDIPLQPTFDSMDAEFHYMEDVLASVRTTILTAICMIEHGQDHTMNSAVIRRYQLVELCTMHKLLDSSKKFTKYADQATHHQGRSPSNITTASSPEETLAQAQVVGDVEYFLLNESRRRAGLMIWVRKCNFLANDEVSFAE